MIITKIYSQISSLLEKGGATAPYITFCRYARVETFHPDLKIHQSHILFCGRSSITALIWKLWKIKYNKRKRVGIIWIRCDQKIKITEVLLWYSNSRHLRPQKYYYDIRTQEIHMTTHLFITQNNQLYRNIGKISKLIAIKYYQIITYQQI